MFINKGNNSLIQGKCIVFALCFFILCVSFWFSFCLIACCCNCREECSIEAFGWFTFCEFLLSALLTLCSCSRCFLLYELLLSTFLALCAFALGAPHFLCPCSKRSLLCELLLSALFTLCYVLGTLHSMCSCFEHFSLSVLLFLVLPIAFRATHGSCIAFCWIVINGTPMSKSKVIFLPFSFQFCFFWFKSNQCLCV